MIVSDIRESARIESLHPLFKTVFDYVKSHDLLSSTSLVAALSWTATDCSSITSTLNV